MLRLYYSSHALQIDGSTLNKKIQYFFLKSKYSLKRKIISQIVLFLTLNPSLQIDTTYPTTCQSQVVTSV
uniref:Uncharacterized protein n=1 Tax=Anguilla anguilla TaxID=7936 RepID=A0A0E9R0C2_ANGAN